MSNDEENLQEDDENKESIYNELDDGSKAIHLDSDKESVSYLFNKVWRFKTLYIVIILLIFFKLFVVTKKSIHVVMEYERLVVFKFGEFQKVEEPGLRFLWPIINSGELINMKTRTSDVPKQEVITSDNVSVNVDAVLFYKVVSPQDAIINIDNFDKATQELTQSTLRNICGQKELDELLSKREDINSNIKAIIGSQTLDWGIEVTKIEIRDITLDEKNANRNC